MGNWAAENTGLPIGANDADITFVTSRIDNLEDGLNGTDALTGVDINGGTIDGTPIGGATPSTGGYTELNCSTLAICGTVSGAVAFASTISTLGSLAVASAMTCGSIVASGGVKGAIVSAVGSINAAGGTFTASIDCTHISLSASLYAASTLTVVGSFVASATADVGTNMVVGSGISTGGNEFLAMDVISDAVGGAGTYTVAHGHVNIRGCSNGYVNAVGTITTVYCDATNIHYTTSVAGTHYFIAYFVTV